MCQVEGSDGRVLRDASSNSSAATVLSGDAEFVGALVGVVRAWG